MELSTYEKLIQNLEDFVFIDCKIVTCLWLCQSLKIHINIAKQLLEAFLQDSDVKEKVLVTYLIGGELKNGSGLQLKLVNSHQKEEVKERFSKITTNHVFSVQKLPSSFIPIDIYNSNPHFYVNCDDRSFCPIKPLKEVEKREVKGIVIESKQETSKSHIKLAKSSEQDASGKPKLSGSNEELPSKQCKFSPEKTDKNKITKGGIADMFNKQNEKKKSDNAPIKTERKEEKKSSGRIGSFFQKQPPKKQVSATEPMEVDPEPHPIRETNNKVDSKDKVNANKKEDENEEAKKNQVKEKKSKGKENRKKRKKRDEKEDEPRKKRKRIASVFSSDSESSGIDGSDCEMEPDPIPDCVPMVKADEEEDIIPPTPGRKRIRKQIDKTYTDEEGFILTKKEFIYESCTDDEIIEDKNEETKEKIMEENKEEPEKSLEVDKRSTKDSKPPKVEPTKKVSTKKSPNKKKSPNSNDKAGNKQSSIMSFFKRK